MIPLWQIYFIFIYCHFKRRTMKNTFKENKLKYDTRANEVRWQVKKIKCFNRLVVVKVVKKFDIILYCSSFFTRPPINNIFQSYDCSAYVIVYFYQEFRTGRWKYFGDRWCKLYPKLSSVLTIYCWPNNFTNKIIWFISDYIKTFSFQFKYRYRMAAR